MESRKVSSALADPNTASKFYNIRGIQSKNGNVLSDTVVAQLWERVPELFDPDTDPDPIDDKNGYGDGVQPAWTARLLGLPDPAQQVITIVDDIEHMTMMNNSKVQEKIAELLGLDPNALTFVLEDMEEFVASRVELDQFLSGVRKLIVEKALKGCTRRISARVQADRAAQTPGSRLHRRAQESEPKDGTGFGASKKRSKTPARPSRKER